jgi:hypothetical protein
MDFFSTCQKSTLRKVKIRGELSARSSTWQFFSSLLSLIQNCIVLDISVRNDRKTGSASAISQFETQGGEAPPRVFASADRDEKKNANQNKECFKEGLSNFSQTL